MKVGENKVVSVYYTLTDKDGKELDQSQDDAVDFLYGSEDMIPGLAKGLAGKEVGDKVSLDIDCADAYGEYQEEMVQKMQKSDLEGVENLEEGVMLEGEDEDGEVFPVVVTSIEGDVVTLNGNHPLAGLDLHFDIEIVAIREATEEEVNHGQVHSDGEPH
tara:strand:- start:367 stop:846 length:480 start_codon:yes stop_codon:yes gene_type:complete